MKKELEDIWPIGWRDDLGGFCATPTGVSISLQAAGYHCNVTGNGVLTRGPSEPLHAFLGRVRLVVVEYHRNQLALHRDAQVPYVVPPCLIHAKLKALLEPLGWTMSGRRWSKASSLGTHFLQYQENDAFLKVTVGTRQTHTNLNYNATKQEVHDALVRVLDLPRYP
jgi:hypothetical protein